METCEKLKREGKNIIRDIQIYKEPVIFSVQFKSSFVQLAAQDNRGISINLHKI